MSKYCAKCNKDYGEGTKFCPECGGQLSEKAGFIDLEDGDKMKSGLQAAPSSPGPTYAPVNATYQQQPLSESVGVGYKPPMEKYGFISMILLSIITLGIYGIYWINKFSKTTNYFTGREVTATGGKLILYIFITLGIYGIYWYYEQVVALNEAKDMRNMPGSRHSPAVCIILCLFGLGIIPCYWMISDANELIDFENWKNKH
ncbi:DUF4234 domain-containing protein [Selenomonas ruminantium]|uniref:DUF4234 domain-containing protein n=1 Tax=Selenomonas ruminantium TaxID=971 RepID=UPI00068C8D67|nr:DUF4234 domain-containing protein [Selenomonas ruminantium]